MVTIQVKRGDDVRLPSLSRGEPAFCPNVNKFFIGDGVRNVLINPPRGESNVEYSNELIDVSLSGDGGRPLLGSYLRYHTASNSWTDEHPNGYWHPMWDSAETVFHLVYQDRYNEPSIQVGPNPGAFLNGGCSIAVNGGIFLDYDDNLNPPDGTLQYNDTLNMFQIRYLGHWYGLFPGLMKDLSDVSYGNPTTGATLRYNGSSWEQWKLVIPPQDGNAEDVPVFDGKKWMTVGLRDIIRDEIERAFA
jgi:hypothetical protein